MSNNVLRTYRLEGLHVRHGWVQLGSVNIFPEEAQDFLVGLRIRDYSSDDWDTVKLCAFDTSVFDAFRLII